LLKILHFHPDRGVLLIFIDVSEKCYGGVKFETNAMVSEYRNHIELDASHYSVFFMYLGRRLKTKKIL
jgi:hypothetical protein